MKKQHIAVLMLLWLFSQQLFAALWTVDSTGANCASHAKSVCTVITNSTEHVGHAMPMLMGSDAETSDEENSQKDSSNKESKVHNNLSMNCDHCLTICQPLVLTSNLVPPVSTIHFLFDAQPTGAIVDSYLSTLFRPPILA
jgi:hypothetical protein